MPFKRNEGSSVPEATTETSVVEAVSDDALFGTTNAAPVEPSAVLDAICAGVAS